MAALTANKIRKHAARAGTFAYQIKNAQQIYAGSLVGVDASTGYLIPWANTANLLFKGLALQKQKGDTSATPVVTCPVDESGIILRKISVTGAAAITDLGKYVWGSSDNDLTLTSQANTKPIGEIIRYDSTSICDVKLFTPEEYKNLQVVAFTYTNVVDAASTTKTSETPIVTIEKGVTVTAIKLTPTDTLTAHATNNAKLIFRRRNADGTSSDVVASKETTAGGTGNFTGYVTIDMGTLANNVFSVGQMLTYEIDKVSNGVIVPRHNITVYAVQYR